MEAVKAFNAELSSLFETRPPISKAKMTSITRSAIKAIKFYKHVVQSVEKFIQKCKPEYKVPGLYVVDSIVRQSRHQFTPEKDVFAPRFARNIQNTFMNLFNCPPEDKGKVVRVLNLWQKNQVFTPDVIQPLLDMASRVGTDQPLQPSNGVQSKTPPATQPPPRTPSSKPSPVKDPAWLTGNLDISNASSQPPSTPQQIKPPATGIDPNIMQQLQSLQNLLLEKQTAEAQAKKDEVKFDKKLLDFDYGEDDEEASTATPQQQPHAPLPSLDSLQVILSNPEVLRHLQTLQQQMSAKKQEPVQDEMHEKMRRLQEMRDQEEEFDKHLAQTVPKLPFAMECDFKLENVELEKSDSVSISQVPPPVAPPQQVSSSMPAFTTQSSGHPFHGPLSDNELPSLDYDERNRQQEVRPTAASRVDIEVIDLLRNDSPPRKSPQRSSRDSRDSRSRRRRSRSRERGRHSRSRSRSRRRARSSSDDRENERRKKKGLPPIKKNHMAVCSNTLWIGHLSKLVQEEELSDTFGHYGDIVSINLIPPRGCAFVCMNRRQDADKALKGLKHAKLHGKAITIAWAPGKGMKDKEWKDYWDVDLGTSYIPWTKLSRDTDFSLLEEGGMLDEETFPEWLKADPSIRKKSDKKDEEEKEEEKKNEPDLDIPMPTNNIPGFIPLPESTMAPPPPVSQTPATAMPPPPMGLIPPPFALPPQRLPGILGPMGPMMGPMGNVPLGVPPPIMMPPPPQQMVPRMPGPPFNPVGMMPLGGSGDKGKPPQMPGMPPDGFPDHLAQMFGLPLGHHIPNVNMPPQQQQPPPPIKTGMDILPNEQDNKDHGQGGNLELINPQSQNHPNFNQPPPNFNIPPQIQMSPQNQNQNQNQNVSTPRSDRKPDNKEDMSRRNRDKDRRDDRRDDSRDSKRRRRGESADRERGDKSAERERGDRNTDRERGGRDRDRRRGGGGGNDRGDRNRREWGKGSRGSKWDKEDDRERKETRAESVERDERPEEEIENDNQDRSERKPPLLPIPNTESGMPMGPFHSPGPRPGPPGFGPRFGPPPMNMEDNMDICPPGPPPQMGPPPMNEFGDFPPMGGDFPPMGDFPMGDFPPRGDFPGRGDYPPRGDFNARDFQPRGDFGPRGFFRGPMRPPMGPPPQGPRPLHRTPNGNGPMFGPPRGPPGPMGMRGPPGPRGMGPSQGRMDGPPHGFMGRGFQPRMRGGPPRFNGPQGMGPRWEDSPHRWEEGGRWGEEMRWEDTPHRRWPEEERIDRERGPEREKDRGNDRGPERDRERNERADRDRPPREKDRERGRRRSRWSSGTVEVQPEIPDDIPNDVPKNPDNPCLPDSELQQDHDHVLDETIPPGISFNEECASESHIDKEDMNVNEVAHNTSENERRLSLEEQRNSFGEQKPLTVNEEHPMSLLEDNLNSSRINERRSSCPEGSKISIGEERRSSFTEEHRSSINEECRNSFTEECRNSFSEERRNSFSEERRNSFSEECRKSFSEERRNSFSEEHRDSFVEEHRNPYEEELRNSFIEQSNFPDENNFVEERRVFIEERNSPLAEEQCEREEKSLTEHAPSFDDASFQESVPTRIVTTVDDPSVSMEPESLNKDIIEPTIQGFNESEYVPQMDEPDQD